MSDETTYEAFEYNPCIRKGKHKPKHKKQKKYEAKVQKTNLIRPKRGKLISNNADSSVTTNTEMFNNMVKLLNTGNELDWDNDYEFLYNYTFRFEKNEELEKKYQSIQTKITQNKFYDDYEDYDYEDDYEDDYDYRSSRYYYKRRYRYDW
jgi:hypothetical protein